MHPVSNAPRQHKSAKNVIAENNQMIYRFLHLHTVVQIMVFFNEPWDELYEKKVQCDP